MARRPNCGCQGSTETVLCGELEKNKGRQAARCGHRFEKMWVTAEGEWTPGRVDIEQTLEDLRREAPFIRYLSVTRCSDSDCTTYGNSEAKEPQVICLECYREPESGGAGIGWRWELGLSLIASALLIAILVWLRKKILSIGQHIQGRFRQIRGRAARVRGAVLGAQSGGVGQQLGLVHLRPIPLPAPVPALAIHQ